MFKKIRTKSLNHIIRYCLRALLLTPAYCAAQDGFFSTINIDIPETKSSDYSVIGWITQSASYGLEQPGQLFSRTVSSTVFNLASLFRQMGNSAISRVSGLAENIIMTQFIKLKMMYPIQKKKEISFAIALKSEISTSTIKPITGFTLKLGIKSSPGVCLNTSVSQIRST